MKPRSLTPRARAAWRAILREPDMTTLSASADPTLRMLAESVARGQVAQALVDWAGPVLIGYRRDARSNPADRAVHWQAELQLRLRREPRGVPFGSVRTLRASAAEVRNR